MELSGFGALGTWRKKVARAPLTAEEALKHLLLSVDVDTLYRCPLLLHINVMSIASDVTICGVKGSYIGAAAVSSERYTQRSYEHPADGSARTGAQVLAETI